ADPPRPRRTARGRRRGGTAPAGPGARPGRLVAADPVRAPAGTAPGRRRRAAGVPVDGPTAALLLRPRVPGGTAARAGVPPAARGGRGGVPAHPRRPRAQHGRAPPGLRHRWAGRAVLADAALPRRAVPARPVAVRAGAARPARGSGRTGGRAGLRGGGSGAWR